MFLVAHVFCICDSLKDLFSDGGKALSEDVPAKSCDHHERVDPTAR